MCCVVLCGVHARVLNLRLPSRRAYHEVLAEFLQAHKGALSEDSVARLERGSALRVLDSKSPQDIAVVAKAPEIRSYLTPAAAKVWRSAVTFPASCAVATAADFKGQNGAVNLLLACGWWLGEWTASSGLTRCCTALKRSVCRTASTTSLFGD